MPLHTVRPFSPTQFIRIFVIVNLTSFFLTKTILESYSQRRLEQRITELQQSQRRSPPPPQTNTAPLTPPRTMGKPKTENTKKAAGNAKKAEAAAQKQAQRDAESERQEASKWSKGAKDTSRKAAVEDKKVAQAAAKAERDRLLAEEEKNQPAKPKGAGAKKAEKKNNAAPPASRGTLDLGQLDDKPSSPRERTLNATGIDNALDALSLTSAPHAQAVDRHPERRFKAAYRAFEERRLPEIEAENPGLRRNQRVELVRKEFERSEENPFNQAGAVRFDASREEVETERRRVREGVEGRLGEK